MKKCKKLFIILMFALFATMATQKSYAAFLEDKYFNKSNPYSGTFSFYLHDLMSSENWNMLCSENNQHLPSTNNIDNAYNAPSNSYASMFSSISWLQTYSSTAASNPYAGKVYHSDEVAYYSVKDTKVCTPKAAYVLNYMQEGVNSYGAPHNYTDIQKAWYNVVQGASNNSKIYKEATAYQTFIQKIAKNRSDVLNPSKYVDKSHQFEDGTNVSVKFPEIKADKMLSFNTVTGNNKVEKTGDKFPKNIVVSYNQKTNKYMIGPFSINYVEAKANNYDFGAIAGFDIYTDASKNAVPRDKWKFVWTEGNREASDFPHRNEIFYIEMDYIQNATMLTGIDVDYKYLIAGAQYQTLTGTYNQYLWQVKCQTTPITNEDGETTTQYYWYFEAAKQNLAAKSQTLALADKAARWYETTKIQARATQGNIKIEKKALDENGKEMTPDEVKDKFGEYQYFDFRIKITHSTGEVEYDDVTVRAGSSVLAGPYSWDEKEEIPTYEVEEIPVPEESGWKVEKIENQKGSLQNNETVKINAVNKMTTPKRDKIELSKSVSSPAEKDEIFKFSVVVTMPDGQKDIDTATIVVPKGATTGNTWISKEYVWYGEKRPEYEISEIETEDSKKYSPLITPAKGYLKGNGATVKVNALNASGDKISYLTVEKELKEGQVTEDTFDFKIKVEKVKNTENGIVEFEVFGVKAGEKIGPYGFAWKDPNEAPEYTVEEINMDPAEVEVSAIEETVAGTKRRVENTNKITGTLVEGETTNLTETKFTNDMTKHSGGIRVIKDIETTEKLTKETLEAEGTKFEIEVVIAGTFVHDGQTYKNSTKVITKSLPDNGNWDFEIKDVVWYGSKAPTFTVTEKNLPTGWRLKTIHYSDLENESTNSEGHSLMDGKTIEATIINELPSETLIDLTFTMSGIVWVDQTLDGKNTADNGYYSAPNGVFDEGENSKDFLKENAEVTVHRVVYNNAGEEIDRTVAQAYKDTNNNELVFPIITKSDGKWEVPRISVPALSEEEEQQGYSVGYDVEFVYDGQTYEPTEFLSYQISSNGEKKKNEGSNESRANEYKNADTVDKDKYAKDSMALAVPDGQKIIAEVSGKTEINANGDTTGIAQFTDGTQAEISYTSENKGTEYPTISKVKTTNDEGRVLDIFKAKARTSEGNLTFPFDKSDRDGSALADVDHYIDENGAHHKYSYVAVYNYCLNINLGLKERPSADILLTKKLDNAKVIVNEKMYQYNYSGNYDLTEEKVDSLDKDIYVVNPETANYKLGLYRTDYYYRADMYESDSTVYDALTNFYRDVLKKDNINDMEMDIYLTYKIKLENSSSDYDVIINSIDDYYDNSFELVKAEESKYLKTQTIGGKQEPVNNQVKVADASDYAEKWNNIKEGIKGSDKDANGNNIVYNKMTANGLEIPLASGEAKEIRVTFKVRKENSNEAKRAIILGQKCNVAEIGSYSTYFAGTTNYAGKIDRDSAPSNVNLPAYNTKAWYEDDTFAAPRILVDLIASDRTVEGLVWEDKSKEKDTENPEYNQKVGDGIMQDDEKPIKDLTTELVEKVMVQNADGSYTEYDYIWPTNQKLEALNDNTIEQISGFDSTTLTADEGKYVFNFVPAGDFVVKFTYGDKKIETAKYYDEEATYYNGQDFKSTKYRAIVKDAENDKYVEPSKYLDMDATSASADHHNSAFDNEVRRLQVVSASREITYENNVVMAEYRDELFKGEKDQGKYYMVAMTPKLDMNIEPSVYDGKDSNEGYQYEVKNVDFGLEERPTTQLTLDKQIEEIIITTSDENTIMDAKYTIEYQITEDGKIVAKVDLDEENSYGIDNLQALNRDKATNQGFRYINVDSRILDGTTITVKYRFTVLNTGEVDRTGKLAEMDYKEDPIAFAQACDTLKTELASYEKEGNSLKNPTTFGQYVGSIYYYGEDGDPEDKVVTSTVRQLVDYIDNDARFSGQQNATTDTSWSNVTATELKSMVKPEIVTEQNGEDIVLDDKEIRYQTENINNLVVSVDSTESTLNNSGFIIELTPQEAEQGKFMASMNLTITREVAGDSDDLQIDNIAEIIKYNNKVGRRDELTIVGNQVPAQALIDKNIMKADGTVSAGMQYERDTSATEVITLSPPFGSELSTWRLQVLGSITLGLAVVAGGIVVIKKRILK